MKQFRPCRPQDQKHESSCVCVWARERQRVTCDFTLTPDQDGEKERQGMNCKNWEMNNCLVVKKYDAYRCPALYVPITHGQKVHQVFFFPFAFLPLM